jgi:hypothetical protein
MMRSRIRLSLTLCVLAVGFLVLALVLPSERFVEVTRGLLVTVAAGVAAAHYPLARLAFGRHRPLYETDVISLGWFMVTAPLSLWAAWYLFWSSMGRPDLWWDDYLLGAFSYITASGLVLILVVVRANGGIVPARAWWNLGIKTACAVGLMVLALTALRWIGFA